MCQPVLYSRWPVTPALRGACRSAPAKPGQRLLHLALVADDADEVLHHALQVLLNLERVLGGVAALERLERPLRRRPRPAARRRSTAPFCFAKIAACSPARLPKTSRSDSELPPSRLAPLMPAAHSPAANRPGIVDICVSASTLHAAHHVVRRRADFHRRRS